MSGRKSEELAELRRLRNRETNYRNYLSISRDRQEKRAARASSVLDHDPNVHADCRDHAVCALINDLKNGA